MKIGSSMNLETLSDTRRKWMEKGRCVSRIPKEVDFFYSTETREQAKAFCVPCPVREKCLEYALNEIDHGNSDKVVATMGVWGGKDGEERVAIRHQRRVNDGR